MTVDKILYNGKSRELMTLDEALSIQDKAEETGKWIAVISAKSYGRKLDLYFTVPCNQQNI